MFATVKDATADSSYEVTTVKNDKGYLDWTSITKGDGPSTATPRQGNVSAPRSNYETPEERAARQVLIVKQSCLAQAVAFNKNDIEANVRDVLETAEVFQNWVFDNNNVKTEELEDFPF